MSRRHRRRHDADWAPFALMGLAALFSLLRGRRAPEAYARDAESPLKPVFTVIGLVGIFVGLGVLLTVLSAVAALGGGGALAVACGVPALFIAFIAWVISQKPKPARVRPEADTWGWEGTTVDGGRAKYQAPAAEPATAPAALGSAAASQATRTAPPPPPQAVDPRREARAAKRAARTEPVQERPPRSPAEYKQRAVSYRRKIQSLIKMRRPGPIADRMTGVLERLKSWEERVGQLADRLTLYEKDDLIQRDVREVPHHIERLRRQLALEAEPEMQRQIQRTLAAYEEQQRQLELLARVMKRTRLNLDDTLAAMGTVYSQLQVLNAMDIDGPTATRIAEDVDREVERLNDLLSAMTDVYSSGRSEAPRAPAASTGAADAGASDSDEDAGLSGRKTRLSDNATK